MRALLPLLLIAAVVALAVVVADQAGQVAIFWQDWRIETSLPVLITAVLLVAAIVTLIFVTLRSVFRAPDAIIRSRRDRRRRAGYRALTQGMVAVAAGDGDEARRQARKADVLLAEPPLTLLLSAQAAQLNGDEGAAHRYFAAMLERPETEFLGLRGLITQALRQGDDATALRLAQRAHALRPQTPWVASSLLALQTRGGQWREAEATLAEMGRAKLLSGPRRYRHQAAILLERSRRAEADGEAAAALSLAAKAQDLAPDLPAAAERHALLLQRAGQDRKAAKAIETAWRRAPHPTLAEIYATLVPGEAPLVRLKRVERLAAANPDHPESHLAVARAALAAQLWGEARRHLALASTSDARVCRLQAELAEAEHHDAAAAKSWLGKAADAPAEPLYVCDVCGGETRYWDPLCPHCREFDRLEWRTPTRAAVKLVAAPAHSHPLAAAAALPPNAAAAPR
ncbi:MAG: heme biosynthesis protein HemY [Rhodospirillales bacterium]|nr:heme biosynthesis protein HemY [Rhodospirillales bacterium]